MSTRPYFHVAALAALEKILEEGLLPGANLYWSRESALQSIGSFGGKASISFVLIEVRLPESARLELVSSHESICIEPIPAERIASTERIEYSPYTKG